MIGGPDQNDDGANNIIIFFFLGGGLKYPQAPTWLRLWIGASYFISR